MREILLAGVCAVSLLATAAPARAQQLVLDVQAVAWAGKTFGLTEQQVATLISQLETLRNVANTALNTYGEAQLIRARAEFIVNALTHPTSINQIAMALNELRYVMPELGRMQFAITGQGGFGSGNWDARAQQYWTANTVYMPPTDAADFNAVQLRKNATSIASTQAIAHENLDAIQQRAAVMPEVQAQIDAAPDARAAQAANGRLLAELNYTVQQQATATNMAVLAKAQHDATQEAVMQDQRLQLDSASQSICSSLSGLGGAVSPGCGGSAASGAPTCPTGSSPGLVGGAAGCAPTAAPQAGIMSGLSRDPSTP